MPDELEKEYLSSLARYVSQPDEEGLKQAYEISRAFIDQNKTLGHLAECYQNVVKGIVRSSQGQTEIADRVDRATEFFFESLAPFEMFNRGYRENIDRLNEVYATVKKQKDEVTQKNRLLENSNKELESFSYAVSHDLKAPLRHIAGFADLLSEDLESVMNAAQVGYLRSIERAIEKMNELIDDLLNLSRVSLQNIRLVEVDLAPLAVEIAEHLRMQYATRTVEFLVQPDLVCVGDPGLMKILLENLLGNAWKYTGRSEHARIELGLASEANEERVFFVRDNGVGFDMEFVEKLFKPFQRLHSERDFPRSGIGLATVSRILLKHRGKVWAESRKDVGTTFFFTLPTTDLPEDNG